MHNSWEWTEDDVLGLIRDEVQESINLDYKASDSLDNTDRKKKEIGKDVSAFANSAGGTILYGVREDKHLPTNIDAGYDPDEIRKEWLEQVINSNIQRRIGGVRINPIALRKTNPGRVIYAVYVPQSDDAPHMASDYRHYKRVNFASVPMEHYEVRDMMRRERYPSAGLARAWFDSVINPLLVSLGEEHEHLRTRTLMFNRYYESVAGPTSLGSDSEYGFSGNQEQFLESYPYMQEIIERHDAGVNRLKQDVVRFYHAIRDSSFLRDVYRRATTAAALAELRDNHESHFAHDRDDEGVMRRTFGDLNEAEHLAILADYIVNDVGELHRSEKTTAPFWNMHKEQLLLLRQFPPLSDYALSVDQSRDELAGIAEELIERLRSVRRDLARQHGLSYERIVPTDVG